MKKKQTHCINQTVPQVVIDKSPKQGASSKPRLTVACVSHGKSLATYTEQATVDFNIFSNFQPGASIDPIFDSMLLTQFQILLKNIILSFWEAQTT